MNFSVDPGIINIYETWHRTVKDRDLAGTVALYTEDAILETPLALAVYPTQKTGIVVGRAQILSGAAFRTSGQGVLCFCPCPGDRKDSLISGNNLFSYKR